jgi:catechol 2,3-dioxygenase-like lactoylglutathione lyase family enzyme
MVFAADVSFPRVWLPRARNPDLLTNVTSRSTLLDRCSNGWAKFLSPESVTMLDHIAIPVSDLVHSKQFFVAALAPLGYKVIYDLADAVGMGSQGFPAFWIGQGQTHRPLHIAFAASDHGAVDAFHRAALAAGGRDNGQPGIRAQYHPDYYAAFVYDPDGNNIEVVCRKASS